VFKKSELDRWRESNRVGTREELDLARIADEAVRAVLGDKSKVGKKR
jgi:hypothetical protein